MTEWTILTQSRGNGDLIPQWTQLPSRKRMSVEGAWKEATATWTIASIWPERNPSTATLAWRLAWGKFDAFLKTNFACPKFRYLRNATSQTGPKISKQTACASIERTCVALSTTAKAMGCPRARKKRPTLSTESFRFSSTTQKICLNVAVRLISIEIKFQFNQVQSFNYLGGRQTYQALDSRRFNSNMALEIPDAKESVSKPRSTMLLLRNHWRTKTALPKRRRLPLSQHSTRGSSFRSTATRPSRSSARTSWRSKIPSWRKSSPICRSAEPLAWKRFCSGIENMRSAIALCKINDLADTSCSMKRHKLYMHLPFNNFIWLFMRCWLLIDHLHSARSEVRVRASTTVKP